MSSGVQLAGCSYLVLPSCMVFEGLTSYSTPISCLSAILLFDWLAVVGGLAGWLGWLGWLAGCWLAGWLAAGCIYYMDGWYLMDVGSRFYGHESDLVLTSF